MMLNLLFGERFIFNGHLSTSSKKARLEIIVPLLCSVLVYISYSVVDWHGPPSYKFIKSWWQPHEFENHHAHHQSSDVATLSDSVSIAPPLDTDLLLLKLKTRDADYDTAYKNGRTFMCDIENYDSSSTTYPAQSQWTTPEQLAAYGWSNEMFPGAPSTVLTNMSPALAALQLSQDLADWEVVNDNHFAYIPPGGTSTIRGTGAHFAVFYNSKDGGILCQNVQAPRQTMIHRRYKVPVPALERLSDDLFINWLRLAGPDAPGVAALRYIFAFAVQNPTTRAVISAIETRDNTAIGAWPGRTFAISETEAGADGVALLGTPNGVAVAYLLSQHKDSFPQKTVSGVTVWTAVDPDVEADGALLTHMLFTFGPLSSSGSDRWGCCAEHRHRGRQRRFVIRG